MGYVRGVIHGTVIGTVVGLCVAPQQGSRTRAQISRAIEQTRSTARTVMPVAQGAVRTVASAAGTVREQVEKRRAHEEAAPYVSVNGGDNGSPPRN